MTMQVRLLLEKGASVEGNIDLDLDILTETPLQVIDCCYDCFCCCYCSSSVQPTTNTVQQGNGLTSEQIVREKI